MARFVRRIVNASPLILLSKIDRLDLLGVGGLQVIAPQAVLVELRAHPQPDSNLERALHEGRIQEVNAPAVPQIIQAWELGAGESAVLAFTHGDDAAEAVLDDGEARRCAQALGVSVRGTLGIVLLAKQMGEIAAARPVIEQLRVAGLYLTDKITSQALGLVGE